MGAFLAYSELTKMLVGKKHCRQNIFVVVVLCWSVYAIEHTEHLCGVGVVTSCRLGELAENLTQKKAQGCFVYPLLERRG